MKSLLRLLVDIAIIVVGFVSLFCIIMMSIAKWTDSEDSVRIDLVDPILSIFGLDWNSSVLFVSEHKVVIIAIVILVIFLYYGWRVAKFFLFPQKRRRNH